MRQPDRQSRRVSFTAYAYQIISSRKETRGGRSRGGQELACKPASGNAHEADEQQRDKDTTITSVDNVHSVGLTAYTLIQETKRDQAVLEVGMPAADMVSTSSFTFWHTF